MTEREFCVMLERTQFREGVTEEQAEQFLWDVLDHMDDRDDWTKCLIAIAQGGHKAVLIQALDRGNLSDEKKGHIRSMVQECERLGL